MTDIEQEQLKKNMEITRKRASLHHDKKTREYIVHTFETQRLYLQDNGFDIAGTDTMLKFSYGYVLCKFKETVPVQESDLIVMHYE